MKNSKKLFLIFLSVLIVAFISCKKDSGGSITTPTFKPSSLVGSWESKDSSKTHKFTVDDTSGSIKDIVINNVTATKGITIKSWQEDKDKDVPEYTQSLKGETVGSHTYDFVFTFKSASSCVVTLIEDSKTTNNFNITKKAATVTTK